MNTEQRQQIESLLGNQSKSALIELNNIRQSIDGVKVSNCLCSSTARKAIAKDFQTWYDNYPKENE